MRLLNAKLKNSSEISLGDFNVFVGGNGVGKTTLISELFHKASELQKNKFLWIDQLSFKSDDAPADLAQLKSSLARKRDGLSLFFYSNAVKNIEGNTDLADDIRFSTDDVLRMDSASDPNIFNEKKFRRPFISFSSCEGRLNLQNESGMTRLDHPPENPINVLYRDQALLTKIDENIFSIFKYHLVLLSHVGTALQLGISTSAPPVMDYGAISKQDEFERIEAWKQEYFIPITDAGHGIRSMIKLLTSLLEPVNQIVFIDEPEMHLYPSQKRWLGKQLVKLASEQKKQVFLVTHDPMILQGILDANAQTNIFRVDRDESGSGIVKYCEFTRGEATHSRNQEQYLQGLFYQRCIVVEGASDRSFYQEMFDAYPAIEDKDVGVVVAGGVGNSKHMVDISAKVGLRAAFVYDLDVLIENQSLMKDIYQLLGGTGNPIEKLEAVFSADHTVQSAPTDHKLKAIKTVCGYERKSGFNQVWASQNQDAINEAFASFESVGVYIVPSGTLESWAPEIEEKVRFAELAPDVVRSNPVLKTNFDNFAKKVLGSLEITLP